MSRLDSYFTQLNAGPNEPYHWQGTPGAAVEVGSVPGDVMVTG